MLWRWGWPRTKASHNTVIASERKGVFNISVNDGGRPTALSAVAHVLHSALTKGILSHQRWLNIIATPLRLDKPLTFRDEI